MNRLIISLFALALLISCSNNNNSGKKTDGGKAEPAFETGIDTSRLNTPGTLLEAAAKFKEAKTRDEQQKKADAGYQDHYLELLKLETLLTNKATALMGTLPAGESASFYEKFRDAMK